MPKILPVEMKVQAHGHLEHAGDDSVLLDGHLRLAANTWAGANIPDNALALLREADPMVKRLMKICDELKMILLEEMAN